MTQSTAPVRKHGCLKAFLAIVIAILALIGGSVAYLFNGLAKSEGATQALARAAASPAVIAKLGTPLQRGTFATGSYGINTNGTGSIDLTLPISGPKGAGKLLIDGSRTAQVWSFKRLIVVPADGSGEIPVR